MEQITFSQFERIYATAKDLVKATDYLFKITDGDSDFSNDVYTEIVMLHNKAIDYIVAMEKLNNKEVN